MLLQRSSLAWVLGLSLVALPGCEEKKAPPKVERSGPDGGAPRAGGGVDRNIAEAVAAVAAGTGAGVPQGPPEKGVFAPGAADREMHPGDLPKVVLGGKGTGPTVAFAAQDPRSRKKLGGRVQVAVQTGPQSAMPTVELLFSFEAAEKSAAPDAPPGPVELLAKVTTSKLAADQPGQLPAGLDKQIAKAKGSVLRFQVAPSGAGRVTATEIAKGFDESLAQVVRSASDALALTLAPYPAEPLGVGAFWMVTSREAFAGLDVVAYRMFKLTKIEGEQATIDVTTKRITAGGQVGFAGLPPHTLHEFSGNATGRLVVSTLDPTTLTGELSDVLLANMGLQQAPGGPPAPAQPISIHIEVRTRIWTGR
jgi:hypothetical protein